MIKKRGQQSERSYNETFIPKTVISKYYIQSKANTIMQFKDPLSILF